MTSLTCILNVRENSLAVILLNDYIEHLFQSHLPGTEFLHQRVSHFVNVKVIINEEVRFVDLEANKALIIDSLYASH